MDPAGTQHQRGGSATSNKFAQRKTAAVGIEKQMAFAERMIANDDIDARAALENALFAHTLDNDEDVRNVFAKWQTHVPDHPLKELFAKGTAATSSGRGDDGSSTPLANSPQPGATSAAQARGNARRATLDEIILSSLRLAGAGESPPQKVGHQTSPSGGARSGTNLIAAVTSMGDPMNISGSDLPQVMLDDLLRSKASGGPPQFVAFDVTHRRAKAGVPRNNFANPNSASSSRQQQKLRQQRAHLDATKSKKKFKPIHKLAAPPPSSSFASPRPTDFSIDEVSPPSPERSQPRSSASRGFSVEQVEYYSGEGLNGSPLRDAIGSKRRLQPSTPRGGVGAGSPTEYSPHNVAGRIAGGVTAVAESPPWMRVYERGAEDDGDEGAVDATPIGIPAPAPRAAASSASMLVRPARQRPEGRIADGPKVPSFAAFRLKSPKV